MEWTESRNIKVEKSKVGSVQYFRIYPDNTELKCVPPFDLYEWQDCQLEDEDEFPSIHTIADELSQHLEDGSVAILSEIGSLAGENLSAIAVAVNSDNNQEFVDLNSVMVGMASTLGDGVM